MRAIFKVGRATLAAVLIVMVLNLLVFAFFVLPPAAGLPWVVSVGAIFVWWHLRRGPTGRPRRVVARVRARRPGMPPRWIALVTGSSLLVMLGVATLVEMGTGPIDLADSPFHQDVLAYSEPLAGWVVFATAAALVVPVIEEFAFRGRLLRVAEREWGAAPAVLFAASVFALVHVGGPHPLLLLVPFVMGTLSGVAVVLTGSVWTAVVMHGAWNGLMAVLARFSAGPASAAEDAGWGTLVASAVVLASLGALGWARAVREWRKRDQTSVGDRL